MKYIVKTGDSLSKIGANLGVSWSEIAKANNIKPPYTIYPGKSLEIPAAGVSGPQPYKGQPLTPIVNNGGAVTGAIITSPQNSGSGSVATNIISMSINGIILYGIFKVLMKAL